MSGKKKERCPVCQSADLPPGEKACQTCELEVEACRLIDRCAEARRSGGHAATRWLVVRDALSEMMASAPVALLMQLPVRTTMALVIEMSVCSSFLWTTERRRK